MSICQDFPSQQLVITLSHKWSLYKILWKFNDLKLHWCLQRGKRFQGRWEMQELKKVELFYVVAVVWCGNCLPNEFIVDTCAPLNFHLGGQIQPVWAKSHLLGQRHVTAAKLQLSVSISNRKRLFSLGVRLPPSHSGTFSRFLTINFYFAIESFFMKQCTWSH